MLRENSDLREKTTALLIGQERREKMGEGDDEDVVLDATRERITACQADVHALLRVMQLRLRSSADAQEEWNDVETKPDDDPLQALQTDIEAMRGLISGEYAQDLSGCAMQ